MLTLRLIHHNCPTCSGAAASADGADGANTFANLQAGRPTQHEWIFFVANDITTVDDKTFFSLHPGPVVVELPGAAAAAVAEGGAGPTRVDRVHPGRLVQGMVVVAVAAMIVGECHPAILAVVIALRAIVVVLDDGVQVLFLRLAATRGCPGRDSRWRRRGGGWTRCGRRRSRGRICGCRRLLVDGHRRPGEGILKYRHALHSGARNDM